MKVPICETTEREEIPLEGQSEEPAERAFFKVNRYETFLEEMKINWWRERERATISESDIDYIRTLNVKKGTGGKVVELCCPESRAISIFGKSQTALNSKPEPPEFDVKEPYFFSLNLYDKDGKEPDHLTRMGFRAVIAGGVTPLWKVKYGDLSPVKPGKGKFKKPVEIYNFPEGLYLVSGDRLELEIINPGIDIEIVEVQMEADIFSALKEQASQGM